MRLDRKRDSPRDRFVLDIPFSPSAYKCMQITYKTNGTLLYWNKASVKGAALDAWVSEYFCSRVDVDTLRIACSLRSVRVSPAAEWMRQNREIRVADIIGTEVNIYCRTTFAICRFYEFEIFSRAFLFIVSSHRTIESILSVEVYNLVSWAIHLVFKATQVRCNITRIIWVVRRNNLIE